MLAVAHEAIGSEVGRLHGTDAGPLGQGVAAVLASFGEATGKMVESEGVLGDDPVHPADTDASLEGILPVDLFALNRGVQLGYRGIDVELLDNGGDRGTLGAGSGAGDGTFGLGGQGEAWGKRRLARVGGAN